MEIWFTRHGETTANIEGIMQGQQDGELTPTGEFQAKLLSLRLSKVKFDEIYCSDLKRARDSLKDILIHHQNTEVYYEKLIREKSGGVLEGKKFKEIYEIVQKKQVHFRKFRPVNGENSIDVLMRAHEFLDNLTKKHINNNFSHSKIEEIKSLYLEKKKSFEANQEPTQNSFKIVNNDQTKQNTANSFKISNTPENFTKKIKKLNLEASYKLIEDDNFINKIKIPFTGFENEIPYKRVLVLSHGGFINEIFNAIKIRQGKDITPSNEVKNTSLSILKVHCKICFDKCEWKEGCEMDYDILLFNNASHLENLIYE